MELQFSLLLPESLTSSSLNFYSIGDFVSIFNERIVALRLSELSRAARLSVYLIALLSVISFLESFSWIYATSFTIS